MIDKIQIWDNRGETYDRYTAVCPDGSYVGMSMHPFHPQGFGQHGEGCEYYWEEVPEECHLGIRIEFEELPEDCQKLVQSDVCLECTYKKNNPSGGWCYMFKTITVGCLCYEEE